GAVATAFGTQSSTVTQSIVVPFAGTGVLSTKQVYPVTVGANLGTTVTALLTAFAVTGAFAKIGLQAAFVHLDYNVLSAILIFVIPILRPIPPFLAGRFADLALSHRWIVVTWIVGVFLVIPAAVVGVYALT
ncbi:MAG: thymidylate synthase, partial [Actinobacteria bacterium]|nr:thymidylate synthase [Actinomycetota bacterium]